MSKVSTRQRVGDSRGPARAQGPPQPARRRRDRTGILRGTQTEQSELTEWSNVRGPELMLPLIRGFSITRRYRNYLASFAARWRSCTQPGHLEIGTKLSFGSARS